MEHTARVLLNVSIASSEGFCPSTYLIVTLGTTNNFFFKQLKLNLLWKIN